MKNKKRIKILIPIFILGLISIINLYNAYLLSDFYKSYYLKQILWYLIGIFVYLIILNVNMRTILNHSKSIYYFNVFLLILVLIIGRPINGTRAWLNLGFISLQPSELMKISLTLMLASINKEKKKYKVFFKYTFYSLIPSILVFIEPDTGAIIFYFIILFIFTISLKIKWYWYLVFILIFILNIFLFSYFYLYNQDILIKFLGTSFFYRVERIINFRKNNYQLELSLISIFSSFLWKNGFKRLYLYVPEGATDFIFAFIIGNFGLILVPIIFICYTLICLNICNLTKNNANKKTNLITISFLYTFLVQIIINITMNIGLIPIIGITLPFLSYGGSSIIALFLFLAIIIKLNETDMDYNKYKNN